MFNDFSEDAQYEANAVYDYKVEAYGDRCPGCGTLRWGGDCPRCMVEEDDLGPAPVRSLDVDPSDDLPLGECSFCGDLFYDEGEMRLHEAAECIGGDERFDSRKQWDTWEEWRGER